MLRFIKNLFQLIISPEHGWEDIDEELETGVISPAREYTHAFLPLIALCSATSFARMLFMNSPGFLGCVQNMIVCFVSLFLAYHIGVYAYTSTLDRLRTPDTDASPDRERLAVMHCVAIIGFIAVLGNVIRVSLALVEFLPIYVIFILWKSCKFLQIDQNQVGFYMLMATFSILGPAYVLTFLFENIV